METEWQIVLIGCLSGKDGAAPTPEEGQEWLDLMQQVVNAGGNLSQFLAFNRSGEPVYFG
jgi:hypothetical protein